MPRIMNPWSNRLTMIEFECMTVYAIRENVLGVTEMEIWWNSSGLRWYDSGIFMGLMRLVLIQHYVTMLWWDSWRPWQHSSSLRAIMETGHGNWQIGKSSRNLSFVTRGCDSEINQVDLTIIRTSSKEERISLGFHHCLYGHWAFHSNHNEQQVPQITIWMDSEMTPVAEFVISWLSFFQ